VIELETEREAAGATPSRGGRSVHRPRTAAVGLVVIAALLGVAVVATGSLHPHRQATATLAPTSAEVNGRAAVRSSTFVTVVGAKILSRAITLTNGDGPLGLIRLGPVGPAPAAAIAVTPTSVIAEGTDLDVELHGTWAYPVTGRGSAVFLGQSTGFIPSVDDRAAWLIDGPTVREVDVATGATIGGPFSIAGRVVAAAGAGLVIQQRDQVVWWLPGAPGRAAAIGAGTALEARGDYILWQTPEGLLTITDPNTGRTVSNLFTLTPSQRVHAVAMTSHIYRVAAATDAALVISDVLRHRRVTVHLGPVTDLAWLDDSTLLARVGPGGVTVVDAATGVVVREPDLGFDAEGLGLVSPTR